MISPPAAVRVTRCICSTESSTRSAGSRSSSAWVRCASATVRPLLDPAAVGSSSPASSRSTEVLPAPLTPTRPTRSPGPSRQVACESSCPLAADQVDVLEVEDVLAEPLGGEPLQLEPVARRRLVLDQRVGGVDPELRLRGAGRRAAAQPGELLAHQVLPPGLRGRRLPLPLGLGQHEGRVAAVVHVDDAVVHLPGRRADRVEEPAVVGDHHERGRYAADRQVPGQPGDRLDVEVVGGLVEDHQVVVAEQQPGQRAAPALAAGQARRRRGRGETPASSTSTTSRVDGSAAHSWSARSPSTATRTVAVRVEVVALGEVAQVQAAVAGDPAVVGLLEAAEQPQQRGLAVAVAADDADPLAGADAEADVVEQRADAVRLVHPLEVDQVGDCHRSDPSVVGGDHPGAVHRPGGDRTPARGRGAASPPATWTACARPSHRNRQARAGAGHDRAVRGRQPALLQGAGRARGAAAARRAAGRWTALAPSVGDVVAAQRRHQLVGDLRLRHRARRRAARRTRGRPPAWTAPARTPAPPTSTRRGSSAGSPARRARADRGAADQANGTSLPSSAASSSSSWRGVPRPHRSSQATSAAAASALPPAIPPATGMPLSMAMCDAAPVDAVVLGEQPRRPDRDVGVVERDVVDGDAARRRSRVTRQVVGVGDRDLVVQPDRLVDGGQRVVAVGAAGPDPEAAG